METLLKVFKALSDETRINILKIISSRVICQKGISKHLQISDSAVSQHIKILKEANILQGYKDGYFVFYQVNYEVFNECISFMEFLGGKENYTFMNEEQKDIKTNCSNSCKGNNKCCKKREEQ
ncbi:MAG: metalloregulator ArsR/SmtB family transcription factor [Terrisporobacter sp.]|uniref:ArsR/SmtB family transcription factor n=1 Tax=Terrisporobacter sp. TaxID=1965305 RepID=UPI002FCBAB7B